MISENKEFCTFQFQVIIPGVWIFSLILNIPLFLVKNFDKKSNVCVNMWPEKWMPKAYTLTWEVMVILPLGLMIGLYSRVVYTLWFKRSNDNQLTYQQKVSVMCRIHHDFLSLLVVMCLLSEEKHQ